ncbi:MAG TPA: MFS transporter [Planctomycetota bacterium]|jgi:MFS family permease|nr:MFS transporter [Planctomycetota bacterium]
MDTAAAPLETPSGLGPFRYRDFSLYQFARMLLIMGGQIVIIALQWQVYALTQSKLQLGMIGLAQFLPNFLASLPAGHVADRVSRRGIVMVCALANTATISMLAWQARQSSPSLVLIYVACSLFGMIRAFSAPAGNAFLPALVPGSILQRAIMWHLIVFQLGTVIGPALGGRIYGSGHAALAYEVAAGLFAGAFVALACLKSRPQVPPDQESFERAVSAGLRYVWDDKRLLGALSLDLFAVLLGGATALMPAVVKDILNAGPEVLGDLKTTVAAGAGMMAFLLAFRPLKRRIGAWLFSGVALFGLATIGFGLSHSLPLSMVLLFIMGASDMLSVTVRHTLIQVGTPDRMRGRVSAVSMVFINTSNELGEFESGTTAAWWGTQWAIVVGGLGTLAIVLAWTLLFPSLRKADRFDEKAPGA